MFSLNLQHVSKETKIEQVMRKKVQERDNRAMKFELDS